MENAYVLISCESGFEESVIAQLKSIDAVKYAFGTFGAYDIIVKLQTSDEEKLIHALTKQIRGIRKIKGTLTLRATTSYDFARKLKPEEYETLERFSAQAYVIIHYSKSHEDEILNAINKIPEVIDGNTVIGAYELICRISAPTYNDISDIVTKKIRRINGVKTTTTLNIIPEQGIYVTTPK